MQDIVIEIVYTDTISSYKNKKKRIYNKRRNTSKSMEEFIETLYNNGDNILFQFFGDEDFSSARYRIINTILFLWYEPAIIFTEILGLLMLMTKNRKINNIFLGINGFMLLGGIAILLALIFPGVVSPWFEGEWITECEKTIHNLYFWVDKHIIWGLAHLLNITYKESNIGLFVIFVPALITVINTMTLIATRKNKGICWKGNLSIFALCILVGLYLFLKLGLGL